MIDIILWYWIVVYVLVIPVRIYKCIEGPRYRHPETQAVLTGDLLLALVSAGTVAYIAHHIWTGGIP